jgi:hypothetical protein
MPILKQEQETREIVLPESGAKLTILSKITYGLMVKIWALPTTDNSSMLVIAANLIVDWDFTDDKMVKLPISADTIKNLSKEDGEFLIKEVSENFNQKKTLASK